MGLILHVLGAKRPTTLLSVHGWPKLGLGQDGPTAVSEGPRAPPKLLGAERPDPRRQDGGGTPGQGRPGQWQRTPQPA